MTVFNRRNALLGWAVWTAAKIVAKQKARQAAAVEGGARRRARAAIAVAVATAGGLALLARRKSDAPEVEE